MPREEMTSFRYSGPVGLYNVQAFVIVYVNILFSFSVSRLSKLLTNKMLTAMNFLNILIHLKVVTNEK